MVTSAGCIGNRVYTSINDDELYSAIPGCALQSIARRASNRRRGQQTLAQYHRERQHRLSTV